MSPVFSPDFVKFSVSSNLLAYFMVSLIESINVLRCEGRHLGFCSRDHNKNSFHFFKKSPILEGLRYINFVASYLSLDLCVKDNLSQRAIQRVPDLAREDGLHGGSWSHSA